MGEGFIKRMRANCLTFTATGRTKTTIRHRLIRKGAKKHEISYCKTHSSLC